MQLKSNILKKSISIILPTLEEEENIGKLISEIFSVLDEFENIEIVVVDDNSNDGTVKVVQDKIDNGFPVRIFINEQKLGLGKSIGVGLQSSSNEIIVVMDSDFTHKPLEITNLILIAELYGFASGSRFVSGGSMVSQNHFSASKFFNKFIATILQVPAQDCTGGFWAAKREYIHSVELEKIFKGYGDYFFVLLRDRAIKKLPIVEVPAEYDSRMYGTSKSKFLNMLFFYTFRAFRARFGSRKLN